MLMGQQKRKKRVGSRELRYVDLFEKWLNTGESPFSFFRSLSFFLFLVVFLLLLLFSFVSHFLIPLSLLSNTLPDSLLHPLSSHSFSALSILSLITLSLFTFPQTLAQEEVNHKNVKQQSFRAHSRRRSSILRPFPQHEGRGRRRPSTYPPATTEARN